MKQKMKLLGLSVLSASLLFVSCAQDGFDEESFGSSVTNTTLLSPASDDLNIASSPDGSLWIVSWPLVKGAGGFSCTVQNVTDPANPVTVVNDSIIDGCTLSFDREDDSNYVLSIRTLGNPAAGNTEASEATVKPFSSFSPAWKEIPADTEISSWLAQNPIPADMTEEVFIDLVAGASYTVTDALDFGAHRVTLRSTTPSAPANIKMSGNAQFVIDEGFTLKNLNIDAAEIAGDFIVGNKTPAGVNISPSNSYYRIESPIYLKNVKVAGLPARFIYDNGVKYCFKTVIVDDCVVECKPVAADGQFIQMPTGFINDLTIRNTTLWNSGETAHKYIVQYNNSGRCDRAGYSSNSININNCTFYRMAEKGQWGNYAGFSGRNTSYFNMTSSIMYNCSNKQVLRRFTSGSNNNANKNFVNNTCFFHDGENGADEMTSTEWDPTQNQVLGDPKFADPANGDFHISGENQVALGIGDPRWL